MYHVKEELQEKEKEAKQKTEESKENESKTDENQDKAEESNDENSESESSDKTTEDKEKPSSEETKPKKEKKADLPLYPVAEVAKLKQSLQEKESWIKEQIALQSKLQPHADPILKSVDIESKIIELDIAITSLKSKKRYVPPRKIKKKTAPKKDPYDTPPKDTKTENVIFFL